jgi:hypothetical protein
MARMKLVQEIEHSNKYGEGPGWRPCKFQTWLDLDSIRRIREGDGHTDVLFQCGSSCIEIYVAESALVLMGE